VEAVEDRKKRAFDEAQASAAFGKLARGKMPRLLSEGTER
jgi:hypothetical protein